MNPLQKCKDHSSLQFYRHRSNRFGKNRLTDACRAVFSKHAAPKSHAFFSYHEPLPPGTRCGEHRGGLSSRVTAAAGSGQRIANMAWRSNGNLGRSIAFTETFDYESITKMQGSSSLQFYRRRSNRFGENRLTDACRAVFQKQAAPKSHAFLFCHEPLPPDTRCGEHRGGLSSRPPGVTCNLSL